MIHEESAAFPVVIRLALQWGEMDAYGHANNTVYFRWFESARMELFRRIGWPELEREAGVGPILHSTRARFRAPLTWPDEVDVGTRVVDVLDDRFTMLYEVRSVRLGRLACAGSGLIVAFDYRAGRKTALPERISRALERLGSAEDGEPA